MRSYLTPSVEMKLDSEAAAHYLGIGQKDLRDLRRRFPLAADGPVFNPHWLASRCLGQLSCPALDAWAAQPFLRHLLTTRRNLEAGRRIEATIRAMQATRRQRAERRVQEIREAGARYKTPLSARAA